MQRALGSSTGSGAISPASSPYVYGPGLPFGGDYGTILAYFVNRGRPTYGFSGMSPSKAVVGVEGFDLDLIVVAPVVYLFLDQSMVDESWYYVYKYLYGTALEGCSPPANTGPVSGSPGPLTLISSNFMGAPNKGYFTPVVLPNSSGAMPLSGVGKMKQSQLAKTETMGNKLLVQISLGNAPMINVTTLASGKPWF